MKRYDQKIVNGVHTVKITLQMYEYVGHIIYKIRGNCKGKSVLDFDFEDEVEFYYNDCQMEYDEEDECFNCVLKSPECNFIECQGDAQEMNDMIVGIEIIDFKEDV